MLHFQLKVKAIHMPFFLHVFLGTFLRLIMLFFFLLSKNKLEPCHLVLPLIPSLNNKIHVVPGG